MKADSIVLVVLVAVMAFSCKEGTKVEEEAIAEYSENHLPNKSDEYFAHALTNLEENKNKEAAEQIAQGIAEIEKEGKNVSGLYKTNLEKATEALKQIEVDLRNDKKIPVATLREVMVNVEINIAHEYLSTSDFYVLDQPDQSANRATDRRFNANLSNLKKQEGNFKADTKKVSEALLNEGKKLEAEYKAWIKKADLFAKESDEHFKENYPEYYMGVYMF